MSVHTKTRPTEVSILGDKQEVFLVRSKDLPKIRRALKAVALEQAHDWRDGFKDLINKYGEAGSVIRGYRVRDDMSAAELARQLGTTPQVVSLLESSKRSVSLAMAKRLAKVFKTDHRVFL